LSQLAITQALGRSVGARGHDLGVRTPLGGVIAELVEGERIGLHFPIDHGQACEAAGSGGDRTPKFQFHGIPPATRRRQTTVSWVSYMPGIRRSRMTGPSSKAM